MIDRPTNHWRESVHHEREQVAAGILAPEDAFTEEFWPPTFIEAVDIALAAYENEVAGLRDPSDDDVSAVAERVVLALNEIDAEDDLIETGERDELCEYIEAVLTNAGIDVDALCARRGEDREALTDSRLW
ncbi:hypothetical protein [Catellatospora sichuanensis]|uniref:hypothetical protein n=1 Tax=Catellatospora sichuanensis TaxID=1969805 RepID=UPI00118307D6|nr:hypothetical protein [Catellatospora sichuanensis]